MRPDVKMDKVNVKEGWIKQSCLEYRLCRNYAWVYSQSASSPSNPDIFPVNTHAVEGSFHVYIASFPADWLGFQCYILLQFLIFFRLFSVCLLSGLHLGKQERDDGGVSCKHSFFQDTLDLGSVSNRQITKEVHEPLLQSCKVNWVMLGHSADGQWEFGV